MSDEQRAAGEEKERWPVGFIVVVTLAAIYLILRLVQMIGWIFD